MTDRYQYQNRLRFDWIKRQRSLYSNYSKELFDGLVNHKLDFASIILKNIDFMLMLLIDNEGEAVLFKKDQQDRTDFFDSLRFLVEKDHEYYDYLQNFWLETKNLNMEKYLSGYKYKGFREALSKGLYIWEDVLNLYRKLWDSVLVANFNETSNNEISFFNKTCLGRNPKIT